MKVELYELCWSGPGILFEGSVSEVLKMNDQTLWLRPKSWIGTGKACVIYNNRLEYTWPLQQINKPVITSTPELIEDWQIVQPDVVVVVVAETDKDINIALCKAAAKGIITM